MFNKWIRIIHRWLAIPVMSVLVIAIGWGITQGATSPLPAWVSTLGIASIFALFISGVYMFFQHYWAKWRRGRRSSASIAPARSSGD
jgi:membrane protein YdbS with pleckstrin-like domain